MIIIMIIGSMYGIYAKIWGILMGSMSPYIAYMDPLGMITMITAASPKDFSSPPLRSRPLLPVATSAESLCR